MDPVRPAPVLPAPRARGGGQVTAAALAHLYQLMRPGETFQALAVTVIDGRRTVRLVLVRGGERRVVVEQDTTT